MKMKKNKICKICGSNSIVTINTYKNYAFVCNDCHSVSHSENKSKYFLEYILPVQIIKILIPTKAFARLFHVQDDFMTRENFYSVYKDQCLIDSPERLSQLDELLDQLNLAKVNIESADVLDISGAPGVLSRIIKNYVKTIEFTELNESVVSAISKAAGVKGYVFDYFKNNIDEIINDKKYDLILIRSSIIFCPDFEKLILSLKNLLNVNGHILIETILPTMGEILWWQQLEYKFPRIYSQLYIENVLRANNFEPKLSYRNYGSYLTNKFRGRKKGIVKFVFVWLIEFPMVLFYQFLNFHKNVPIDNSMNHKMLTQIWAYNPDKTERSKLLITRDIKDSKKNSSFHFTRIYNGFLKNLK